MARNYFELENDGYLEIITPDQEHFTLPFKVDKHTIGMVNELLKHFCLAFKWYNKGNDGKIIYHVHIEPHWDNHYKLYCKAGCQVIFSPNIASHIVGIQDGVMDYFTHYPEEPNDEDFETEIFITEHVKPMGFQITASEKVTNIEQCSVCLEAQSDIITSCKHQFCKSCIETWTDKHLSCPCCRNKKLTFNSIE